MGRFDSTVPYYARYREPYPASFFQEVARRETLSGAERLIDIGCGPGSLAIGFAPYVKACTGVDIETGMLAAARVEAARAGVHIDLIQARIEDLPENIGQFHAVTIGPRAALVRSRQGYRRTGTNCRRRWLDCDLWRPGI